MRCDAQNGRGGNLDRSKTKPHEEESSNPNANTLALPQRLEDRLARIERRLDAVCPMARHGSGCSFACPISLSEAVVEVLRDMGGAA